MLRSTIFLTLALAVFSGCASSDTYRGGTYSSNEAGKMQTVRLGEIIGIRNIVLQKNAQSKGTNTTLGTIGGGALGGVMGSGVGKGTGAAIATVGGAILGAIAGSEVQNRLEQTDGVELTIRLEDASVVSVAQKADEGEFSLYQRVQIVGDYDVKVVPLN